MDLSSGEARARLKDRLMLALKGAAGSLVLASATLMAPSAEAAQSEAKRPTLDERVAGVRKQAVEKSAEDGTPGVAQEQLAWGNWHNWRNGWPNGWRNWHNWHNWW